MHVIFMKVTHRYQTLLLSHGPTFMTQVMVQNGETCPASDLSVVYPSNPKSLGHSQHLETGTDLCRKDSSK